MKCTLLSFAALLLVLSGCVTDTPRNSFLFTPYQKAVGILTYGFQAGRDSTMDACLALRITTDLATAQREDGSWNAAAAFQIDGKTARPAGVAVGDQSMEWDGEKFEHYSGVPTDPLPWQVTQYGNASLRRSPAIASKITLLDHTTWDTIPGDSPLSIHYSGAQGDSIRLTYTYFPDPTSQPVNLGGSSPFSWMAFPDNGALLIPQDSLKIFPHGSLLRLDFWHDRYESTVDDGGHRIGFYSSHSTTYHFVVR